MMNSEKRQTGMGVRSWLYKPAPRWLRVLVVLISLCATALSIWAAIKLSA